MMFVIAGTFMRFLNNLTACTMLQLEHYSDSAVQSCRFRLFYFYMLYFMYN